ncbi:Auxin efflux carrier family protein [Rhynchospora pubera]|uniref:Auxin efflux carrier family protein n=1 Tax=Rhynchospora pubera TaxID=906938 RepID=A0AAV8H3F6_9POAL|nr:Auxin efflux carrier family protein [Rhynchospora pubera]
MGLLQLFVTASMPVLNVLLVTGVGSFLATDSIGILSKECSKYLNNVVFYVFNPALVATNLSGTITMESMALLWFMPVNVLLTFILGLILGWAVIQITRAPTNLRGLILGCCAAGNLGNLLLIIIPAICKEKGSPFGDHDRCRTYGLGYASLSMALGAIFLWSIVYNIVRITSMNTEEENKSYHIGSEEHPFLEETDKLINAVYSHLPVSDAESPSSSSQIKVPLWKKATEAVASVFKSIDLKKLLAPSTIGVMVGFAIGLISPIQNAMIGESAPLRTIQESATLIGEGAIPSVTLIMGGNLLRGIRRSNVSAWIIAGVILVRYIILPLLGVVIVKGAVRLGLVHADPLYQFVLLLQYAVPPAMNISTMTQLFGAGEKECSVIFIWLYSLASVALTLWSTFFMWSLS